MKAKESASWHRKRSTELRGQSDKLANSRGILVAIRECLGQVAVV